MPSSKAIRAALLAFTVLTVPAFAEARHTAKPVGPKAETPKVEAHWLTAWASAQMIPDPNNALKPDDLKDATLRQIVRVTAGGNRIRVRLSNAFGTAPLRIDAAAVAFSTGAGKTTIVADSSRPLTFAGQASVIIPAGADYLSDPPDIPVTAMTDLAITTWQAEAPAQQTSHPGARTTSFLVHGNHVTDADLTAPMTFEHWFELSAVEVETTTPATVAMMGDSITDGRGSTTNGNNRWPDVVAQRLQSSGKPLAVINLGIGGNRLLLDGLGPNVLARLDRDVIAQPGVKYMIVLEGVNDLGMLTHDGPVDAAGHQMKVANMIAGYQQVIDRAHAHGIKIYGATVMPFTGFDFYHPDATNEADRQAVNAWIRTPGHFDAVIDFDAAVRDPAAPDHLKPEYDSGDHIHPSAAGYAVMGAAVPLDLFK